MEKPFDVVCPTCGAAIGAWCHVRGVRLASGPHARRIKLSHGATRMNHMNAETLLAVLREIANTQANSNSEPDCMGEALDHVVKLAGDAARNYTHAVQAGRVVGAFEVRVPNCDWPVHVRQIGQTFTITYGSEVRDRMTYDEAGDHFGHAIFHALACAGVITNPEH